VHRIAQAQLRILLLAEAQSHSQTLLDRALTYGDDAGALVTVIGELGRSTASSTLLDGYRQQYAGDLRIFATSSAHHCALDVAHQLLELECFDLVIDTRSAGNNGWHTLLAAGRARALLLPARDPKTPWPLSPAAGARWRWLSPQAFDAHKAQTLTIRLAGLAQAVIDEHSAAGPAQLLLRTLPASTAATRVELDVAHQDWLRQPQQAQLLLASPEAEALCQEFPACTAYADLSETLAAMELPAARSWLRL
jgi:hypothetical protein